MSDATAFAGLDLGSSHTKAVLCTPGGTVLSSAVRATPLGEHDAQALVTTALDVLAEAVAAAGRAPDAVGLTGMAETGTVLDADGRPVGPLLAWTDPRGAGQAAALARTEGAAALHAATGVRPSAKAPLAKWCWLRENHPEVLASFHTWAGAADLVAHALTGRIATDATFAQRTMAFDVHRGAWSPGLAALAGLDAARLPRVTAPGEAAGRTTGRAAGRIPGLAAGTPVVVAGHDHVVGAFAAGVRDPGQVADSLGTAEAVLTVCPRPPDAAAALAQGMGFGRHADGRRWFVMAGHPSCGALLDQYAALLRLPGGAARHRALGALLAAAGEGPTGIVVEPYPRGRVTPEPDPDRTLALHGLTAGDGAARLALALVEGTAHQARWMTEAQAALTGAVPREVTVLGGQVAQPRWTAVKAAVTPWPLRVLAQPHAPAVGAALLAGRGGPPWPAPLPAAPVTAGADERARYDRVHREEFLPRVRRTAPGGPRPGPAPRSEDA
jgi:xylulokinase